jgi:hypothetical protein
MIYEGSNGIQALDLVTRKLLQDEGQRYNIFVDRIKQDITRFENIERCKLILSSLHQGLQYLSASTDFLLNCKPEAIRDVEAGATDYLNLLALVASSWMWLRMVAHVDESTEFGLAKLAVGNFHAEHIMPECQLLSERVMLGASTIDSLSSDVLAG